ncbi:DUF397 domain-containing protein [Streptomyces jumonjinensis]|uniref:DUF397 domain-containing protein n=1 Tax=Streptomyces jumonjinensis TaxID=1945 RepID=UPI0037ACFCBE
MLEVQHHAAPVWRKSSYSSGNGQCVEVRDDFPGVMPVRDSKVPTGPCLAFAEPSWMSFVGALKTGTFRPAG